MTTTITSGKDVYELIIFLQISSQKRFQLFADK